MNVQLMLCIFFLAIVHMSQFLSINKASFAVCWHLRWLCNSSFKYLNNSHENQVCGAQREWIRGNTQEQAMKDCEGGKKRESIGNIVQSQSYKQKAVMRYVLWAFHCFIRRFALVGIVWVQEALIALRQKQIHAVRAWTLIWICAFLRNALGVRAGYVFSKFVWRYVVSIYWGPLKAICGGVGGSRGLWGAFIQQIPHCNHQKPRNQVQCVRIPA